MSRMSSRSWSYGTACTPLCSRMRLDSSSPATVRTMGEIKGERTVEIDAPIETCFAIAADIENAPEWQGSLKDVEVIERDGAKRAALVETASDAKVKTVKTTLRFSYDEPNGIDWTQEKGDVKSLDGYWRFEEL